MKEKFSRFEQYMNQKNLNDNKVTKECGLSQGQIYQMRKGKSDMGLKTIEKILKKYPDLNKIWLLTGTGNMINNNNENEKENEQNISNTNVSGSINNTNTNYHNNYYNDKCKEEETNNNKFIEILHEQLKEKDRQIAEKDWQIRQIITMKIK